MKIYSAQLKGTTTVATGSNVSLTGSFTGSIYGFNDTVQYSSSVDSRIVVNTNRLNNIESKSASVDISISNINSVTSSFSPRVLNLESKSASVDISISNINAVTASNIARLSNLETKSSSVDISITNINSFTASNDNTSLNSKTGSYATTGSNSFFGTQVFSGSVYIANDLIVQGSSSIQYISASSVSIGTNIVQLNTANPSVRFAGLTMIDSGSVGGSGSFLYDSLQDEFIFVHRGNGTNVTSSHFVLGPETYDSLGNETYLTCNRIPKGTGKEHLINSCIFDNGGNIGINCATPSYNLDVNGCGRFYQSLTNSTSYLIVENNRARNAAVYTATTNGGFYAGTSIGTDTFNYQIYDGVAGSPRITISSTGITCFACRICAPTATITTLSSTTAGIGNFSHTSNYSATSGCFGVICAYYGAIIYLNSMHNNGTATYQYLYSNGPTGGASLTLIGSTSAYGPACTTLALCGNGWVYAYQPYGGATYWNVMAFAGNYTWAF